MRHHGAYCILVSGGFSFFTKRIARRIGFHDHKANELAFENDKLTGKVCEPILGRSAKLETLNKLCAERGLRPNNVLAVGDGANDIKMIEAAGLGVAFHGSESLKKHASASVDHCDLTALLYYQGYSKSQFVTI
jgi:phosphoserine phosphatase